MNSIFSRGRFFNHSASFGQNNASLWTILKRYIVEAKVDAAPAAAMPVKNLSRLQLDALPEQGIHLARLGHSTILLKINGDYWLLDPVFSERASPVQFIGPKRFHQPPLAIADLPPIKGVLLSHDHYDHLDKRAIKQLRHVVATFYVPLGVARTLRRWGVNSEQIREFDWWQQLELPGLTLAATPAQHFSGRGLGDANQSLWCSWVIIAGQQRLFFSGDSGYFPGFKLIGEKYGPFDLTMVETGAYDAYWPDVHMHPEQSLQAHLDLQGKQMMPVHNGTFDLAFHAWYEPLEQICMLAQRHGVSLLTPAMGQLLTLGETHENFAWWRELQTEQTTTLVADVSSNS